MADVPSLSELMQGGNPAVSTNQPGVNYGRNEGINLLFQAATNTARERLIKDRDIQQRKEDVFKGLSDLSQVPVHPADRERVTEEFKTLLTKLDPSIFSGRNELGRLEFEKQKQNLSNLVYTSKQDYLNAEVDEKTVATNPEYQNGFNRKYLDDNFKKPLGERRYEPLIPTPVFDFKPAALGAAKAATRTLEDATELGDYIVDPKTGQQVFQPNPNGKRIRKSEGGTSVDVPTYEQTFTAILEDPVMGNLPRKALEFQYQYEMTPEQQKALTLPDGTIDYQKAFATIGRSLMPQGTSPKVSFDDDKFALQAQKDAAALKRMREKEGAAMGRLRTRLQSQKQGSREELGSLNEMYVRNIEAQPLVAGIVAGQFKSMIPFENSLPVMTIQDGKVKTLKPIGATYDEADLNISGEPKKGAVPKGGVYNIKYTDPSGKGLTDEQMKNGYELYKKTNPGKTVNDMVKTLVSQGKLNYVIQGANGSVDRQLYYDAQRILSNQGTKKDQTEVFTETVDEEEE